MKTMIINAYRQALLEIRANRKLGKPIDEQKRELEILREIWDDFGDSPERSVQLEDEPVFDNNHELERNFGI